MRHMQFQGIPSITGKTPEQAVKILYEHCHLTAQVLDAVNREVEELKQQVEELSLRQR